MKLDLISILYLLGAAQALILCIGININKPLQTDLKKTLTLLLSAIMVVMVYYVVVRTNYQPLYPYIDSMGSVGWMAICPLYYLFHCSLLEPKWRLRRKHLLLFPISILFLLEGWLSTIGLPFSLYNLLNRPQLYLDLWTGLFFGTGIYFTAKSIQLLKKQEAFKLKKELLGFSYILLVVLAVFWGIYLLIRTHYNYAFEYTLIGLFELFIFAFVYRVFKVTSFNKLLNNSKYTNQRTDKVAFEKLAQRLDQALKSKQPFLDKKLSLVKLAEIVEINTNDLSQLFSEYHQSNFYEFINYKRLDYFEKLVEDPAYKQFKIMAIAEMSGFNSKTPFYTVFKERHQMTPSEYIKRKG